MKRTLLSSTFATIFTACVIAAPISRNEAISLAEKFLSKKSEVPANIRSLKKIKKEPHSSSYSTYYIFNLEDHAGYVVIAGDDRVRPVLAYAENGSLDDTDMPEACRFWLTQYDAEINSLGAQKESCQKYVSPRSSNVISERVEPLIQTKWDQKYPYNIYSPENEFGGRCLTGCVATATAQVMRYYSYPERGTGKVVYADNNFKIERTLDFSTLAPFEWDNMTFTYDYSTPIEKCNAVANLMKAVGHGVKMQYSTEASMAYHRSAGEALIEYFGYDRNLHLYERTLMSAEEWEKILLGELNAGRPVIYDGRNPDMGHTFICDGYDGEGMFHFNWGWSGTSDGYFSLTALNPGEQGSGGSTSGYNNAQAIICNIAPSGREGSEPQKDYLLAIDKLYYRDASGFHVAAETPSVETTLADGQLFFYCFHKGFGTFSGETCTAVIEGEKIMPIVYGNKATISGGNYASLSFPLSGVTLTDGAYNVGFFYRNSADDGWHRITAGAAQPKECLLTVKGENITLSQIKDSPEGGSGIQEINADKVMIDVKSENIHIMSTAAIAEVSLFSLDGQKIISSHPNEKETQVDISTISSGIYVLLTRSSNGNISTMKIKI